MFLCQQFFILLFGQARGQGRAFSAQDPASPPAGSPFAFPGHAGRNYGEMACRQGGQKALVLLEGKSPRQADGQESWQGRDEYGAIVHVPVNEAFAGQMIACRIEAARRHSLVGRQEG